MRVIFYLFAVLALACSLVFIGGAEVFAQAGDTAATAVDDSNTTREVIYVQTGDTRYYNTDPNPNAGGVGTVMERLIGGLSPAVELIKLVAVIVGMMFFVGGLVKLRHHVQQPTAVPLGIPAIRLLIGLLLIILPFIMGLTLDTAFGSGSNRNLRPSAVVDFETQHRLEEESRRRAEIDANRAIQEEEARRREANR